MKKNQQILFMLRLYNETKNIFCYSKYQLTLGLKILLFFLFFQSAASQENFVSAGGEEKSGYGSVTYTIGQIFFQESTREVFTIYSGLQIPYSAYIFTDPLNVKLEILIYPNPTTDYITISVKDYLLQKLKFQLFSIDGKLIESREITQENTVINMEKLATSTYMLNVVGWITQGSYKIIKQ